MADLHNYTPKRFDLERRTYGNIMWGRSMFLGGQSRAYPKGAGPILLQIFETHTHAHTV